MNNLHNVSDEVMDILGECQAKIEKAALIGGREVLDEDKIHIILGENIIRKLIAEGLPEGVLSLKKRGQATTRLFGCRIVLSSRSRDEIKVLMEVE